MKSLNWKSGLMVVVMLMAMATAAMADTTLDKIKADLQVNHTEAALEELQKLIQQQPDNYQAWFLHGVANARLQKYHQAIESFRRVIELNATLAEPHNNLAVIYNELGDVRAAITELEQSLKKRPGYAVAEENLADLYVKLALEYYKEAMAKEPNPSLEQRYTRLLQVRDPNAKAPKSEALTEGDGAEKKEVVSVANLPDVAKFQDEAEHLPRQMAPEQQVLKAVEMWRRAWSRRDLGGYFAAYASDFQVPAKYKSLQAWRRYKHRVIDSKTYIQVDINDLQLEMGDDGRRAKVKFFQKFRSNSYNGDDHKLLEMRLDNGKWKIVKEVALQ